MQFSKRIAKLSGLAVALGAASMVYAQQSTNILQLRRMETAFKAQDVSDAKAVKAWADKYNKGRTVWKGLDGTEYRVVSMERGRPVVYALDNLQSAKTMGVNELWPTGASGYNLTGTLDGATHVGIWDGGEGQIDHPEFGGRLHVKDPKGYIAGDHATHTAGTIMAGGADPNAKGKMFLGTIDAWDYNNDVSEVTGAASYLWLSSHSYGRVNGWRYGALGDANWVWFGDMAIDKYYDVNFGMYSSESATWDGICYNAPYYLPVFSAGNTRNGGPSLSQQPLSHWVFDATGKAVTNTTDKHYSQNDADNEGWDQAHSDGAGAKNPIMVAAVQKPSLPITSASGIIMSGFSSWGPFDDGRVKPDISAPGVHVYSSVTGNGYDYYDGTSMATPNVTGTLGLLQDLYFQRNSTPMRASMLKALMINTAREAGPADGPDYAFGWGFVNALAAADLVNDASGDPTVLQDVTLSSGGTTDIPFSVGASSPMKVTIAWTDPEGAAGKNAYNDRTPSLVNDVDLRVIRVSDGAVFEPWILNPDKPTAAATTGDNIRDNVEQVYINAPEQGTYIVRINAKNASLAGGSQIVSVAMSAALPSAIGSFSITPTVVLGGAQNSTGTIFLATAQATDTTFTLKSSNTNAVSVASTATIPAGGLSASFPLTTNTVRPPSGQSSVKVTIFAQSPIGGKAAQLTLLPITVAGISLNPTEVAGGTDVTGTITLNGNAGSGGAVVSLSSDLIRVVRPLRNYVVVPAGQNSVNFTLKTFGTESTRLATIKAFRLGTTVSQTLKVRRPELTTVSNTVSGRTVKLTVNLDGPAPTGGAQVTLSSTNSSVLAVPSGVLVPSGKKSVTITLTAAKVTSATTVTIKASRGTANASTDVTVNP